MKSIGLIILCIIICYVSFAQNNSIKELNRENYLHKSRVKKIIGYSFLGSGVALFITGGIIDKVKKPELLAGFGYEVTGVVSTLISIPFFISASKNKKKALLLTLNTQKTIIYRQNVTLQLIQPTATIKIIL